MAILLFAACGEQREKQRIETLSSQLGGLVGDGAANKFGRRGTLGWVRSYGSDFVDADVFVFKAGAIEAEQTANLGAYLNEYYGHAVRIKKESLETYGGVRFRAFHFVGGYSNTKMLVTLYRGAYLQVMLSWPIGASPREGAKFMDALVNDLKERDL